MAWLPPVIRGAIASSSPPPPSSELYTLPTTTGLELWLNAQNGVVGSPTVATWEDQHTTANNMSNFSNTLTVSSNTYNGLAALNFAANSIFPSAATGFSNTNTWTVFLVCTTTSDSIWMLSQVQIRMDTSGLGDIRWIASGGSAIVSSPTNAITGLNIYTFVVSGTSCRIYQNGIEQFDGAVGNITSAFSRVPARAYGDLTDWLVYSATPTDSELNTIGATLSSRYGLSWTTI